MERETKENNQVEQEQKKLETEEEEVDIDLNDPEVGKAAEKIQASFRSYQKSKTKKSDDGDKKE